MPTLFEAGVNIFFLLRLLSGFQEIIGGFGLVGGGASIHDMHVVNAARPLRPEVSNEEIQLYLSFALSRGPFEIVLPSTYGATCVYLGVVTYVRRGEGLARKVGDPIT